ncbi:toxin-antitoxin system YwqK family antitoxin [Mucilaginibacter segetis]|uniref:MORN repeat protein n=1 Tax=Mucilaginibacter segetis TaxID=2793071 RepID=A0A934UM19_9SPHI|nr:hypothetical protein [Mucilaginibacter segetis]MBK0378954.1 hypothetical protein [Mucilaginibacter segetis]
MFKSFIVFIFISFFGLPVFAQQTRTYFFKEDGSSTTQEFNAKSFILMTKQPDDTVWYIKQYDMDHNLMASGSYMDDKLITPHGYFKYYKTIPEKHYEKFNFSQHKIDTGTVKAKSLLTKEGVFLNGKKSGKWMEYNENGNLKLENIYVNNLLNGTSRTYDNAGNVIGIGDYADNQREGVWRLFRSDGEVFKIITYKNDKIINAKSNNVKPANIKNISVGYDLANYLNHKLDVYDYGNSDDYSVVYHFRITKEGKLTDPEIYKAHALRVDTAIVYALLAAPNFKSAIKNNEPVPQSCSIILEITVNKKRRIRVKYNYYITSVDVTNGIFSLLGIGNDLP